MAPHGIFTDTPFNFKNGLQLFSDSGSVPTLLKKAVFPTPEFKKDIIEISAAVKKMACL